MRTASLLAALSAASVMSGCAQQPAACSPSLAGRTSEVNGECCDEPEEDCSSGRPASCNVGCARMLLPFFSDCGSLLGKAAGNYQDVVALCQSALPDWSPGLEPTIPPPPTQPDKYTSRAFTYGKYYAIDPEDPAAHDTTDNSCVTAATCCQRS